MALEPVTFITDFVDTNPTDSDPRTEGNEHIQRLKTGIQGTFANFAGIAMTATEAELNILDGVTSTTAELNYNDITTLGTWEAGKVLTAAATTGNIDCANLNMSNIDIDSGAIDNTAIGAGTESTGAFTTLTASTSIATAAGATITEFSTDGTMGGNSATALTTESAVKTYVDTQIAALKQWSLVESVNFTGTGTIETTSIPSGTTHIKVVLDGLSRALASSSAVGIEIGSTTYSGAGHDGFTRVSGTQTAWASGIAYIWPAVLIAAADDFEGVIDCVKHDGNTWSFSGNVAGDELAHMAGTLSAAGEIDRLRIVTPATTWDAGTMHVWCYS